MVFKRGRNARKVFWFIVIAAALLIAGIAALQVAIARNGPAVLNAVDRLTAGSRGVVQRTQFDYGPHPAQKLAVFGPEMSAGGRSTDLPVILPVILFVHGGSWATGDPDDYGFIARSLVPSGFIAVLAGYRLHPDGDFPVMVEDTAAAIAWVEQNIAQFGGDPSRITLMGHSAGAYNVMMTALDRQWLARQGNSADRIAGVIGLSGPYDFYPFDSDSTRASFGAHAEPGETQPVNFVRGDAPALLLIHGGKDTTVKPRNSHKLETLIKQAGGQVSAHYFAQMDHSAPLLALASPWRRDPAVRNLVVEFARNAQASFPVQPETR